MSTEAFEAVYCSDDESLYDNLSEKLEYMNINRLQDEGALLEQVLPFRNLWKNKTEQSEKHRRTEALSVSTPPFTIKLDVTKTKINAYILQDDLTLLYKSKHLNKTEQNFTDMEKELYNCSFALGVWFYNYIWDRNDTKIITNNRELINVVRKPVACAPHRFQNYLRCLHSYTFEMVYEPDIVNTKDKLEEKVIEAVEGLNTNVQAARTSCLMALRGALSRKYLAHILAPHRATLADHLARALRKGKSAEKRAAAALAPILALQVGEDGTEFVSRMRAALVYVVSDRDEDVNIRVECCNAVSVLCYVLVDDTSVVLDLLTTLQTIFCGSYLKDVAADALHAAALDGWSLLLQRIPLKQALRVSTHDTLKQLVYMLQVDSLEVRMSAGSALCAAHEVMSAQNSQCEDTVRAALPVLALLAKDSNKHRAKRDRKVQRATFRDILKYLEDGEIAEVSFGIGDETLVLRSWSHSTAYSILAQVLGAGMQACVQHSKTLRVALRLTEHSTRSHVTASQRRESKKKMHLRNAAASKARSISRGNNRDNSSNIALIQ